MKYLFTVLTLLFCDFAYAQNNFGFADATIVYKRGDSMLCLIKREVNYGEVITYKIHQDADESQVGSIYIKSIRIASKYIENIAINNKEKLATLILSGKLTLFNYVETQKGEAVKFGSGGGMYAPIKVTVHYIIKSGSNFIEVKEKTFEKDLKNLLTGCPAIISKLENHDYAFADIPAIIEQYNTCSN
jgi:hypothetical protein